VAISTSIARTRRGAFPLGTLVVNVTGGAALGLLVGLGVGGDAMALLGAGLLGSYTTFSTWMLDTEVLVAGGRRAAAVLNVAAPLAAGMAATGIGWAAGALLS
jgi:CrcB protein